MCKWSKWGDTRLDPCMKNIIELLNDLGVKTYACCCGHGKYPMTIVAEEKTYNGVHAFEVFTMETIPRKTRFYKRDKQGHYYIPECVEERRDE